MAGLVRTKVCPDARHECLVEALHQRFFMITVRYELLHPFSLKESLHIFIQQILACVCLEPCLLLGVGIDKELLKGVSHSFPEFVLFGIANARVVKMSMTVIMNFCTFLSRLRPSMSQSSACHCASIPVTELGFRLK